MPDRFTDYDDDVRQLVLDFEATILKGQTQFFDVDELEVIIDYYLEVNDREPLQAAVEYAERLYPDSSSIRLRRAHLLIVDNRYDEALQMMLDLRQREPDDTDVLYSLGVAYGAVGKSDEAIRCYLAASADGWELGRIYTNIAEEYFKQANYAKSADYYQKALQTDSYDSGTLYGYLEVMEIQGAMHDAVGRFQHFLMDHPYHKDAWYCLGRSCQSIGLYERAVDAFEYAIAIDRHFLSAYEELSCCFELQGRLGEAASALARMLEVDSQRSYVYRQLGALYARADKLETALMYFRSAVETDPADATAISQMAICYLHLNDIPMAVSTVKQAMRVDPENAEALFSAALVSDAMGHTEKASEYFDRLIVGGNYTEQHCRLYTSFLYHHDLLDVMIPFAEESLDMYPHSTFYSTYLAAAYYRSNRYNKARSRMLDAHVPLLLELCPSIGENPLFVDVLQAAEQQQNTLK